MSDRNTNWQLHDWQPTDFDTSVRNARLLAEMCRANNEAVMPMAADVAQALADAAGMNVEAYGLSGGALAELIDHLADRYEEELCSKH